MRTKIQEELELSKKYDLREIEIGDEKKLVELTPENVAKVEAMIRTDSNYRISLEDPNKSPYWILEMKKLLYRKHCDYDKDHVVQNLVEKIDNENSVHLNADNEGRRFMQRKITDCIENGTLLKYLGERNFHLIHILSERTKQEKGGRCNVSFASKFCHFSCFYIFDGEEAQDNFSIYDGVVAKNLPIYLDYYEQQLLDKKINLKIIKKEIKKKNYEVYSNAIDAIIEASGSKISRNGFDHLVWYYFKGK